MRKITTAAIIAIAMTGILATNANATVEVANPGNFTIDANFRIDQTEGQADFNCDASTFEASVGSGGELDLYEIDLDSSNPGVPSAVDCDKIDDCDQVGAGGQIYGPGDATYDYLQSVPAWGFDYDYIVKFEDWCMNYNYGISYEWGTQDIYSGITGDGENQTWVFHTPQQAWKPGWALGGPFGFDPSLTPSTTLEITNTEG